jgi:DNA-binding XRE family transcriptional regulator
MRKQIKKNKLRHYRRLMNWTQLELAEAVGSRQQYIGTYERGIIGTPKCLKPKIASVLGLPFEVVFPEDTDRTVQGVGNEKSKNRDN